MTSNNDDKQLHNSLDVYFGLVDTYGRWDFTELIGSDEEAGWQDLCDLYEQKYGERVGKNITYYVYYELDSFADTLNDVCKLAVQAINDNNGKGIKISFVKAYSPREYNYTTDSFDFVFDDLGEFKTDDEAMAFLSEWVQKSLDDDGEDFYWTMLNGIQEILYEHYDDDKTTIEVEGYTHKSLDDALADLHKVQAQQGKNSFGFDDLTMAQKQQLAQQLLTEQLDARGEGISYSELAQALDIVGEQALADEYGGTSFVADDFCK